MMSLNSGRIGLLVGLMSTVEEIEKVIGSLPRKEFWKLTRSVDRASRTGVGRAA